MAVYDLNKDNLVERVLDKITKSPQKLKTGFEGLDELTGGLCGGKLYVLGGRPAMGKTSFALNLVARLIVEQNKKVVFYTLEYSAEQLLERLIQITSKVIKKGRKRIEEESFEDMQKAIEKIKESNMIIDDSPVIDFESKIKEQKDNKISDADVIIVDYLQLIRLANKDAFHNGLEELDSVVRSLKHMARELDVPVIVLSQLNRAVESRLEHRPIMSDLGGLVSIEECADVVMFLYRDEYYEGPYSRDKGVAEIIVVKNHDGDTGIRRMAFIKEYRLFANLYEKRMV